MPMDKIGVPKVHVANVTPNLVARLTQHSDTECLLMNNAFPLRQSADQRLANGQTIGS